MKKARLDLLEEMPDIELAKPEIQTLDEETIEEIPVESGRPWAFNKMLLIVAPVALVVLIITGVLIYYLYTKTTVPTRQEAATKTPAVSARKPIEEMPLPVAGHKPAAAAAVTRTIYIKDFMIDLKDNKGNNRILVCDIAFDVAGETEREKLEDGEDVRNIIYRTAQHRGAVALKSVEERKKFKKDLTEQLDKLAGKAVVKNVYFIKYFII